MTVKARSSVTVPDATVSCGCTAPSARMLTTLPSRCDRPLTLLRANAHTAVATPRRATGITLSTRAVATVLLLVDRIASRYCVPSVPVITMASPTSLVPGNTKMPLDAVTVSVSAGPHVEPPVTVTVVAVVFVPSYDRPQSTKKHSSRSVTCRVWNRSTYRLVTELMVRFTMT